MTFSRLQSSSPKYRSESLSARHLVRLMVCLLLIVVVPFSVFCDSQSVSPDAGVKPTPVRESEFQEVYEYTGYNDSGDLIAEGWVEWDWVDSTNIVGVWQIARTGDTTYGRHPRGSGELTGELLAGQLHIDLDPVIVCYYSGLRGTISGRSFTGTWWVSAWAADSGRFIGIK